MPSTGRRILTRAGIGGAIVALCLASFLTAGPAVASPVDPLQSAVSIAPPSGCSATRYISPSGSDSATGATPQSAWRTVAHVNSKVLAPGTCVLFEDSSTFPGVLTLGPGDANNPSNRVVVGTYITGPASTATRPTVRGIRISNVGGVTIQDIRVQASGTATKNGIELSNTLGNDDRRPGVTIQRVDVTAFPLSGILIDGRNTANQTKSGFSDVLVQQVDTYGNGDAGIQSSGYLCDPTNLAYSHLRIVIRQVAAFDNLGIPGKTVPTCAGGTEATNSGNGIVLGDTKDSVIERSFAFRNGINNDFPGGGPIGIWTYQSDSVAIQNNWSYSNRSQTKDGGGFDLDGGVTNSIMQYNYSFDNTGAGYLVYQYEGARVMDNNIVRYNISRNDGRGAIGAVGYGGIVVGEFNSDNGPTNTFVYGNSIYLSGTLSGRPQAAGIRVWGAAEAYFYNNSIHITGAPALATVEATADAEFLGNNYFRTSGFLAYQQASGFADSGPATSSLAAWPDAYPSQVTPGYNSTLVSSTATYVDAGAFSLNATSGMRNAGVNVTNVGNTAAYPLTSDYFGITLPPAGGLYSIGVSQGG